MKGRFFITFLPALSMWINACGQTDADISSANQTAGVSDSGSTEEDRLLARADELLTDLVLDPSFYSLTVRHGYGRIEPDSFGWFPPSTPDPDSGRHCIFIMLSSSSIAGTSSGNKYDELNSLISDNWKQLQVLNAYSFFESRSRENMGFYAKVNGSEVFTKDGITISASQLGSVTVCASERIDELKMLWNEAEVWTIANGEYDFIRKYKSGKVDDDPVMYPYLHGRNWTSGSYLDELTTINFSKETEVLKNIYSGPNVFREKPDSDHCATIHYGEQIEDRQLYFEFLIDDFLISSGYSESSSFPDSVRFCTSLERISKGRLASFRIFGKTISTLAVGKNYIESSENEIFDPSKWEVQTNRFNAFGEEEMLNLYLASESSDIATHNCYIFHYNGSGRYEGAKVIIRAKTTSGYSYSEHDVGNISSSFHHCVEDLSIFDGKLELYVDHTKIAEVTVRNPGAFAENWVLRAKYAKSSVFEGVETRLSSSPLLLPDARCYKLVLSPPKRTKGIIGEFVYLNDVKLELNGIGNDKEVCDDELSSLRLIVHNYGTRKDKYLVFEVFYASISKFQ